MEHVIDYEGLFSPEVYMKSYYNAPEGSKFEDQYLTFVLTNLSKIANTLPVPSSSDDLLLIDVGSGPCIHTVLSLSSRFQRIICTDISSSNRAAIQKWLTHDESAHSWSALLQFCASLEPETTAEQLESRVRNRIIDVKPCNVLNDASVVEGFNGEADAVISSLCIEAACDSVEQYRNAICNVVPLIKPGGHLVLVGVLGETFYKVGDFKFHCLKLSMAEVEEALTASGMKIVYLDEKQRTDQHFEVSDWSSAFVLMAKKCDRSE